ncbi:hypothetical protein WMW71_07370 [Flavobacterium buctense]|uniref:Uncharacterized protein n=1 Tax=Flavobacterium buctense TaxID=1648146 RepID=A0ABU9E0I4_9FLAO|nr:hypothetical protein [Flavobacterium buctense]
MTKIITTIALFVCSLLSAQTQFEQGMGRSLGLWGEGKAQEASDLMERISAAEKTNWLPNYYVALINTTEAFKPANKAKVAALLEKAQNAQDAATMISPNNPELMVMQAMIYTAMIVQDPMVNGMKYSPKVMELYTKARIIAPENPRVVFSKADFEMGGAQWTGADVKKLCEEIASSIPLFERFKPETPFHPNWGLERAQQSLKNCK